MTTTLKVELIADTSKFITAMKKDLQSAWEMSFGRTEVGKTLSKNLSENLSETVKRMSVGVGKIEGAGAKAGQEGLIAGVGSAVTGLAEVIVGAITGAITGLANIIVAGFLAVLTAVGVAVIVEILKGIADAMKGLTQAISVMGMLIGQIIRPFLDLLIPFFMALNILLLPLVRWMNLLMRPVFQALMEYMKENVGKVQKGEMKIEDFFTGYVVAGLLATVGVVTEALGKLGDALHIGEWGKNLWQLITEKIPPAIGSFWDWLKGYLPPVVGNLGDWIIKTVPKAIGDVWSWLTDLVPKPTEDVWAWLGRIVGKVSGTIWDFLKEHIPGLDLVSGYITTIGSVITGLKDKWDNDWGPAIEKIISDIKSKIEEWKSRIGALIEDLNKKWEGWKTLIEKAILDTCASLGFLTAPILGLKKIFEDTASGISKAWEDWKTKTETNVNILINAFKSLISPISDLKSAIDSIVSYIRGLIASIPDVGGGASNVANAIGNAVGGAIGYTENAFNSVAGNMGMSWDSPAAQSLMGLLGYQFGGLVPETKPYLLHAGEEVIPRNEGTSKPVNVYLNFNVTGSVDKATAEYAVRLAEERFASSLRKYTRGYP